MFKIHSALQNLNCVFNLSNEISIEIRAFDNVLLKSNKLLRNGRRGYAGSSNKNTSTGSLPSTN